MTIKESLKTFYNNQAEKFSKTRQKDWPEFSKILDRIESYPSDRVDILELGCGDGRFFNYLKNNSTKEINYQGVDFSRELIELAKKNYGDYFYTNDMAEFLEKKQQQSFDFVVAIASFQHLTNKKERLFVLKNIYRILKYGGGVIMINWSFSKWFLKKFKKNILKSFIKFVFSLGLYKINDIFIPWKSSQEEIFYRYYHIFTPGEISSLVKESGFVVYDIYYVDNKGNFTNKWQNSRNTFCYVIKDVVI